MCARPEERSVISQRLSGHLLRPNSTVAQSDRSSLMDLLVQSWFLRWLRPAAASSYSSSISPPRLCPWISIFRSVSVVQKTGFSPLRRKAGNMCVNHTLLVRWSSARGLHGNGNSDVTHTELAHRRLPHRMINKWCGESSQPPWMIVWTDCTLRSCGLKTSVSLHGANHHCEPVSPSTSVYRLNFLSYTGLINRYMGISQHWHWARREPELSTWMTQL